jgi:hypothetical protein
VGALVRALCAPLTLRTDPTQELLLAAGAKRLADMSAEERVRHAPPEGSGPPRRGS